MPCFKPLETWIQSGKRTANGKRVLLFQYHPALCNSTKPDLMTQCGRCIGCLLSKSREWSVRCMHEASLHWDNCWLTLTLNDEYLATRPNPFSVQRGDKSEVTRFFKRLRKKYTPKMPKGLSRDEQDAWRQQHSIRYFYCAEYGETCFFCNKNERLCPCPQYYPWRGRPHYHVCLFNHDFSDKKFFKTINGCHHYTSDQLDSLWTCPDTGLHMGWATISDLTPDSAAYTARYSLKKIKGDLAEQPDPATGLKHYQRISPYGEVLDLVPEYNSMSRRSGIGKGWLDKYSKEILDNDAVLFKELRIKPPRYYDLKLEDHFPEIIAKNKKSRIDKAKSSPDNTPDRLAVREYIAEQKATKLCRKEI